jgi:hypothetical protein
VGVGRVLILRSEGRGILVYSTLVLGAVAGMDGHACLDLSVALAVFFYTYMYNNLRMGLWIFWKASPQCGHRCFIWPLGRHCSGKICTIMIKVHRTNRPAEATVDPTNPVIATTRGVGVSGVQLHKKK